MAESYSAMVNPGYKVESQMMTNMAMAKRIHLKHPIVPLVLGPVLLYYTVFHIFPLAYSLVGSFHKWKFMDGIFQYNGWGNYQALFQQARFWQAMFRTLWAAVGMTLARTVLGLGIAMLIFSVPRLRSFFRMAYFMPVVTSMTACALLWKYFYHPSLGLFNMVLGWMHIGPQPWLRSTTEVMPSIMAMVVWKELGYVVVLYLAGLAGVPASLYEAGLIDGANRFQIFRRITLPFLQNVTLFIVATSLIGYMQLFGEVYMMTGGMSTGFSSAGGPDFASNTAVVFIWEHAFGSAGAFDFGIASAASMCLFVLILSMTLLQAKAMRSDWGY